ncbi:MAG: DUF4396 domain-containing protein [Alphaproteobacteria bacterium]
MTDISAPTSPFAISWRCRHTWKRASINTAWCLAGCAAGDMGTIFVAQQIDLQWPTHWIMALAMMNGLITSIALETGLLLREHSLRFALRTAFGMSFISMLAMELAMNALDWGLTGGARLTWWVVPPMLFAGFITPLPYNYWRLKAHGKSCH